MTTTSTTPIDPAPREAGQLGGESRLGGEPQVDLEPVWVLIKRLPAYVRLSTNLARDSRVPKAAKASLALGGIYLVSPIDLIPGIIPVAGQLDDLYVLLTGLQQAVRLAPDDVVEPHLTRAGLTKTTIDEDLVVLRTFVRQGVAWAFHKSGDAALAAGRQTRELIGRVRTLGNRER